MLHGRVALVTVTGPGAIELCPCCGRRARVRIETPQDAARWNLGESIAWRRFNARLKVEMLRRYGERPPRVVVRVAQRQKRGVDHLHLVMLARTPDQMRRVRLWVALYREFHVAYGFGYVDDPDHLDRAGRTRWFEHAHVCGIYLGNYLAGGQLEQFLGASDRAWMPVWVAPALKARSGWSLERCRWVRQAYAMSRGQWSRRTWYGHAWFPSWWFSESHREWVLSVVGWDGKMAAGGRVARRGPTGVSRGSTGRGATAGALA